MILLHILLSPPWIIYTTSTTRYNFSMDTNELYISCINGNFKQQDKDKDKDKDKVRRRPFMVLVSYPFQTCFTGDGLVKGGN